MERKSCALIAGSRAAGLLEKGEKSTACLRFKMALAVQLAQLIDAGTCHFFSCMQPGAEQWAAAMVLEFARSRPDISLTVMATPELERSLPARVERQAEILHKKSSRACLNCTPFVRQYVILNTKWGALLCQKECRTRDILQNSKKLL